MKERTVQVNKQLNAVTNIASNFLHVQVGKIRTTETPSFVLIGVTIQ